MARRDLVLQSVVSNPSYPCGHISGFTPGAKDLFKQENYLAMYRLPSDEVVKETMLGKLSSITKRRPPLSHMINLFVKDTTTSKAASSLQRFNLVRERWGVFCKSSLAVASSNRPVDGFPVSAHNQYKMPQRNA